jgi:hypothetical protein
MSLKTLSPKTAAPRRRLRNILPLPKEASGRLLAYAAAADSVGSGIFAASSVAFFVGHGFVTATEAALAITVSGLLALGVQAVLGRFSDNLSSHSTYAAIMIARAVVYSGFIWAADFPTYAVLLLLGVSADRAASPFFQIIVSESVSEAGRTRTMASVRALRNLGLGVGFAIAAAVLATDLEMAMRIAFGVNAASFLVLAWAALHLRSTLHRFNDDTAPSGRTPSPQKIDAKDGSARGEGGASAERASRSPWRDWRYVLFTAGNAVLSLHNGLLFVGIPLWIVERTDLSLSLIPVTLVINAVITVLAQGALAALLERGITVRPLVPLTAASLVVACTLMAFIGEGTPRDVSMGLLLAGIVVLSIAENLQAVVGWELSFSMASPDAKGRYISLYNLGVSAERAAGPAVTTAALLGLGITGWGILSAGFLLAAGCVAAASKNHHRVL